MQTTRSLKHLQVFEYLLSAINRGEYRVGERLPVDMELARRFGASRPTVAKALSELQARGLVERRVGSGTYVVRPEIEPVKSELLGLLIPDTGSTEIFDTIVRQIKRDVQQLGHGLLLGDLSGFDNSQLSADERASFAEAAGNRLVAQGVTGVFFAPVEFTSDGGQANLRVLARLEQAGVPVVLIDRDVQPLGSRSPHDLVSVDHFQVGILLASHLWKLGRRRFAFVARQNSAVTSQMRQAGAREVVVRGGGEFPAKAVRQGRPEDPEFVQQLLDDLQPDAIICSNDETAAQLMRTLETLNVSVPADVAVVGLDNVPYAELLRVPLTTIAQPCEGIGQTAVKLMLERIRNPNAPRLTVSLEPKLIIRRSCGSLSAPAAE